MTLAASGVRTLTLIEAVREALREEMERDERVVEIYPRLLSGPVHKSSPAARRELLESRFPGLDAAHRQAAVDSEDAFDAAVSALVMLEHAADLAGLPPETDPLLRLEGRIWYPNWRAEVRLPT